MSLRTIHPTLGEHLDCLKQHLVLDVTHQGDPDSVLLSPCCVHGYRAVFSNRPKLDFVAAGQNITGNQTLTSQLQNLADRSYGSPGIGGVVNEGKYDWQGASGADQIGFFTERQTEGLNGSWVLTAGVSSFDNEGFPVDVAAKWWSTTGNAELLQDELAVGAVAGQGSRYGGDYYGDEGPTPSQNFRRWISRDRNNNTIGNIITTDVFGDASALPNPRRGNERSSGYNGYAADSVYWVLYGERVFQGIVNCNDSDQNGVTYHVNHGAGDNWSSSVLYDPEVFGLITPTATARGGYKPKLILYGGDVIGASATPTIDADGNITGATIDDPGATVITHSEVNSIQAPKVTVDIPGHYYAFNARAKVSTDPEEIKSILGNDLFISKPQMFAQFCDGYIDPIAQTFMISKDAYPNGVFVPRIDLCFAAKPNYGDVTPLYVEIRGTVNGHPHADKAIAITKVEPKDVNVVAGYAAGENGIYPWDDPINPPSSTINYPTFDDAQSYTNITFERPVYLPAGEYAIVLRSNSDAYRCWISDINQRAVNSNDSLERYDELGAPDVQATSKQYGGVFFRSSNGRTWEPNQNQDLMFKLYACNFGNASQNSPTTGTFKLGGNRVSTTFNYDRMNLVADSVSNPDPEMISISAKLNTKEPSGSVTELIGYSGNLIGETSEVITRDLPRRMEYTGATDARSSTIRLDYTVSTENQWVSPVIDTKNIYAQLYQNDINDGGLTLSNVKIENRGTGYATSDTFTVSGGGSKANATLTVTSVGSIEATDEVATLAVTNAGQGFHKFDNIDGTDPIVITYDGPGSGSGAVIQILSEEGTNGGNSKMRYTTKTIDLAPGMEARGLKVYLSAKEPYGSDIYVYYKVRSRADGEGIDRKRWKIMKRVSPDQDFFNSSVSPVAGSLGDTVAEYEFESEDVISYTDLDNNAHDTFGSFAIKIVGQASNPAQPPVINNMRAVAVY